MLCELLCAISLGAIEMREKTNGFLDRYDRFMERKIVLEQRETRVVERRPTREQASEPERSEKNKQRTVNSLSPSHQHF